MNKLGLNGRRVRLGASAIGVLGLALTGASCGLNDGEGGGDDGKQVVYAFWPNTTTPEWPAYYIPAVKEALAESLPDVELIEQVADNDPAKQLAQVDAATAKGADAAIFVAASPDEAAGSLKRLSDADIPVVAYLHDPNGGEVFGYVAEPWLTIGESWGQRLSDAISAGELDTPVKLAKVYGDPTYRSVYAEFVKGIDPILEELESNGDIEIVCEGDTKDWAPQVAQQQMDQCLTKTGNDVDAVMAMNDSTSDGVWAALKAQDLNGEVPIYGGKGGTLSVVQRILAGEQEGSFMPDKAALGTSVAKLLEAALADEDVESSGIIEGTYDNGFVEGGVPAAYLDMLFISGDNVQDAVDAGVYTKDEACSGIGSSNPYCQ